MQLMRKAYFIFRKDLQQEFRTRYVLNAIMLFAVVTLTAVSFSIGSFSTPPEILSALLWIILFFSAMTGLAHIFIREEETHTADTLKLVSSPLSVFLGKFMFNVLLLFALELIIVPLFFAVMNFSVVNARLFLLSLVIGSIGLSAGATIIAAIIAKASAKGALFSILSFPILLPVLVSGISATRIATYDTAPSAGAGELQMLIAYGVVIITASIMVFDFIWNG